jgi:hypothetical protein
MLPGGAMKTSSALVCFGMALVIDMAYADPIPVASRGETLLVSTGGQLKVEVRIYTHEVQIGKPSDGRPAVIVSNCTYSKYPCGIVDRIQISVNGKRLFVPRSAFCDLADLNRTEISVEINGSTLRLEGGDGAESFIAKIEFDATQVKRRTVEGGESGGQLSEETNYHVEVFE